MACSILLTGFRNSSAQKLITSARNHDTLLLPNDKKLDGILLTRQLVKKPYDLIVSVGQKPNIKDKICIETTAKDVYGSTQTKIDCGMLVDRFAAHGIHANISSNAGTSYCNALYLHGLRYLEAQALDIGMVFIHIPYEKNMLDQQEFQRRFLEVIGELEKEGVDHLWKR